MREGTNSDNFPYVYRGKLSRKDFLLFSGLNVPSEVAVFSWKRLETGKMAFQLDTVMQKYRPGQVFIGRFSGVPKHLKDLDRNYYKIYENKKKSHYILRGLSNSETE